MVRSLDFLRAAALAGVIALTASPLLPDAALAQDYAAGLDAYDRGEFQQAIEILQPLADAGDARAQYGLGKIYETGGGPVTADPEKAVFWYNKSAQQGVAAAQNNLALMYAEGRGVDQNKPEAFALWEAAARGGHPHAQYNMGLLFYRGEGVERDVSKAAAWFGQAAENGLAEAQFAVAEMHRLGVGLPQDDRKALGWYQIAAAQGHEAARSQAGRLRSEGTSPVEVQGTFEVPAEQAPAGQLAETSPQPAAETQAVQPEPRPADPPEPEPAAATQQATQAEPARVAAAETEPAAETVAEPQAESAPESAEQPEQEESAVTAASEPALPSQQLASASPAAPASGGAFSLWLGSMGDEGQARELSDSLTTKFGDSLAGADLSVRRVEVGDSGVFYRVVAGSWPSIADARSVCHALRYSDPAAFCKVLQD